MHNVVRRSFHRRYGKGPLPRLAEFGNKVFLQAHGEHLTTEAEALALESIWPSRLHVFKTKTIKRTQPAKRLSSDLLEVLNAVPWNLKGGGLFDPMFFFMQKQLQIVNRQLTSSQEAPCTSPNVQEEG